MTTRSWDPLRDLLNLQERMNRLFEDSLASVRHPSGLLSSTGWTPLADVYETPEAFVVQVDLPGLREDDLEIHVDGDQLVLRGERRPLEKARPESFHRMERSYGAFTRTFQLTSEVDPDRVSAQFRDGLLRLELPKLRHPSTWRGRSERLE
jgi:HSP20 family protein